MPSIHLERSGGWPQGEIHRKKFLLADTPWPRGFGAALASVDTLSKGPRTVHVASPLCLVGSVRWDPRSDRVPPLQTIIFSSVRGRTPVNRLARTCPSAKEGRIRS